MRRYKDETQGGRGCMRRMRTSKILVLLVLCTNEGDGNRIPRRSMPTRDDWTV